jgi:cytochrome c-type biogenesis protein CcmE
LPVSSTPCATTPCPSLNRSGKIPSKLTLTTPVVAQGVLETGNRIIAKEVLAKHDEKYTPPEIEDHDDCFPGWYSDCGPLWFFFIASSISGGVYFSSCLLETGNRIIAKEVLAKHDEKYTPPEIEDAMKKNHNGPQSLYQPGKQSSWSPAAYIFHRASPALLWR